MLPRRFLLSRKVLVLAVFALLFGSAIFFLRDAEANPLDAAGRDEKRISDLQHVQNSLESYFAKCGYYPGGVQSQNVCSLWIHNNTWKGMGVALVESKIDVVSIPNDPLPGRNYLFSVQQGGKGYVLGAILENAANSALTQGAHGNIEGLDCSGSMYCVRLFK